jgi:hypothetical protein
MLLRSVVGGRDPQQNHILDALPPAERERLFPHLKLVKLALGKVLYESGIRCDTFTFRPTPSVEIAVVGNDGAIGVALFMGGETTTNRAIVQSAGSAYQLTGVRLKEEFERHGGMLHILLRYTQALLTQMAQTAVCKYRRGRITVLDRPRLERLRCECYAVVKKETDRLLPLNPLC